VPLSKEETENGYIDIFLQRNPLFPDVQYEWVWEIKYIKKEDEKTGWEKKREEALVQLGKYRQSERFKNRTDVKFAALLFTGKDQYDMIDLPSS
jgi:uncharacterized protein YfeS